MSAHLFDCTKHIIACQHIRGYFDSTAKSQEQQLHLAVKQYTPRAQADTKALPNETSVTIIAAHAVGTVKELYEPLLDELLQATRSDRCAWSIRSIWIADVSTHGESAALNEGSLGVDGMNYC